MSDCPHNIIKASTRECVDCGQFVPANKPKPTPAAEFFKAEDFQCPPDDDGNTNEILSVESAAIVANRILSERSVRVYGVKAGELLGFNNSKSDDDTHTALLIDVRPLEQDSLENIVRDALDIWTANGACAGLAERARKLLENK